MTTDNPGWAAWRSNYDHALSEYIQALLWTSDCRGGARHDECRGEDCDSNLLDLGYTSEDLTTGAAREIDEDFHGFVTSCLAERPDCFDGMTSDMVGYDFALTRNGHGAGFWDRGLGEMGEWLTRMSKPFGTQGVQVDGCGCDSLSVHG